MQVSVLINGIANTVKALTYTFPTKGNAPADYKLTVNRQEAETRQTGGGKYPRYTYFKHEGASYYLPKNIIPDTGTDIVVIPPEPKAAPVTTEEKPMNLPASVEPVAAAVVKAVEEKATKGKKQK
jgi:hypothetical protein